MAKYWYLVIGGIAGTLARYAFSGFICRFTRAEFPYGTLGVNLLGCFLIGLFWTLSEQKLFLGPHTRLLLMTGFCGAFTTFSALIFETSDLFNHGQIVQGVSYVLASFIMGFLIFRAGIFAGRIF